MILILARAPELRLTHLHNAVVGGSRLDKPYGMHAIVADQPGFWQVTLC